MSRHLAKPFIAVVNPIYEYSARPFFCRFLLDPIRGELNKDGVPIPLEPKVLDLIVWLATHPGQLVSREDLIENVWNGRIVSDSAISSAINAARVALGDSGSKQRLIKTVPRRGFRFQGAVEISQALISGVTIDRPSLAVLPFENLSGDPEQSYFSGGITDDIITELSRYDELFVIARHSSFTFRGASERPDEIARALGVQYIAEGSVRRAGGRINAPVLAIT
ncbi:winged helix-turn-helix domain-containing protein [Ruegeria arenilitoris]|uniref:winged helix-turn-helix domain-containing protein n=1 Tax=Ruegeria arenilitoris TaxID=1173585 RepID=UPI00147DDACA|nr:winged helix-turn-helix domain-containing protein [Ruegeria arenilitoris]